MLELILTVLVNISSIFPIKDISNGFTLAVEIVSNEVVQLLFEILWSTDFIINFKASGYAGGRKPCLIDIALYIFIPPIPSQSRLKPAGIKPDVLEGVPVD